MNTPETLVVAFGDSEHPDSKELVVSRCVVEQNNAIRDELDKYLLCPAGEDTPVEMMNKIGSQPDNDSGGEEANITPVLITESFYEIKSVQSSLSNGSDRNDFENSLGNYSGFSGAAESTVPKTKKELWEERSRLLSQILDDDEFWDTDLEDDDNKDYDPTGRNGYRELCENLHVVPVSYFVEHIMDPQLVMRHHGLGPKGAKAIAKTLQTNCVVEHLDLTGNWMEMDGGIAMGRMLLINTNISHLILSDNRLHSEGVYPICQALMTNTSIRSLDLSGNDIGDAACKWIAELLENSKTLVELCLARNNIGSEGGEDLGEAIAFNDILEVIDISWNKIRSSGGIQLITGIKENVRIKQCNISWNGFGKEGGSSLAEMIAENQTVQELDISGNRLDSDTAAAIGRSITTNETLEKLCMGHNPIKTSGLLKLIVEIHKTEASLLNELHLTDIPVHMEFIRTVELIQMKRPSFVCTWGLELRFGNSEEDTAKGIIDIKKPIVLLKEHLLINDNRFIEILQQTCNDNSLSVSVDQFTDAAKEFGAPLREDQINEIRQNLDKYGNGTIYFGDFVKMTAEEETTLSSNDESS